jgi:hypothetical protein
VGYATVADMRKMFEKAILEEKYHIMITVEGNGDLESFTYGQGISDGDIVLRQILKRKE